MGSYAFGAERSHGVTSIATITVPTAAARLAATPVTTGQEAKQGITLQADSSNSGTIYIGGPTVSTANGIQIAAGASFTVPVGDPYLIWAIASGANQVLRVAYV